jgi:hypothetical protein
LARHERDLWVRELVQPGTGQMRDEPCAAAWRGARGDGAAAVTGATAAWVAVTVAAVATAAGATGVVVTIRASTVTAGAAATGAGAAATAIVTGAGATATGAAVPRRWAMKLRAKARDVLPCIA